MPGTSGTMGAAAAGASAPAIPASVPVSASDAEATREFANLIVELAKNKPYEHTRDAMSEGVLYFFVLGLLVLALRHLGPVLIPWLSRRPKPPKVATAIPRFLSRSVMRGLRWVHPKAFGARHDDDAS